MESKGHGASAGVVGFTVEPKSAPTRRVELRVLSTRRGPRAAAN